MLSSFVKRRSNEFVRCSFNFGLGTVCRMATGVLALQVRAPYDAVDSPLTYFLPILVRGAFFLCFPIAAEQELGAMINSTEKMRLFKRADRTEKDDLSAFCKRSVDLPPVSWESCWSGKTFWFGFEFGGNLGSDYYIHIQFAPFIFFQ